MNKKGSQPWKTLKLSGGVLLLILMTGCTKSTPPIPVKNVQLPPAIDQVARFKQLAKQRKMKWFIDQQPRYHLMCASAYNDIREEFLDCQTNLQDAARIAADQIEGKIPSYSDRTRNDVITIEAGARSISRAMQTCCWKSQIRRRNGRGKSSIHQ
jgi:hypothetical protein